MLPTAKDCYIFETRVSFVNDEFIYVKESIDKYDKITGNGYIKVNDKVIVRITDTRERKNEIMGYGMKYRITSKDYPGNLRHFFMQGGRGNHPTFIFLEMKKS